MAELDTIGVTATNTYKQRVLQRVFRHTGATPESDTEMELTVIKIGGTGGSIKENVRFRRDSDSVYIHGYDIAIPAGAEVIAFEFREIGQTDLTATVTLATSEQKKFDQAGILYIDEIRFGLNVSLAV